MNLLQKSSLLIVTVIALSSCNLGKKEVLKASLDVGTCCSGELTLYDNNKFKIYYTTFEDDWGSTIKGAYQIDGDNIILNNPELTESGNVLISTVGDLFSNKYRINKAMLRLIGSNGYDEGDLSIRFIDSDFFKSPCGFDYDDDSQYSFSICDSYLAQDTIDFPELEGNVLPTWRGDCELVFSFPKAGKLIEVERQVYVYPTIWCSENDYLIQFTQINDLMYVAKRKLELKNNNTCIYPPVDVNNNILKKFQDISKEKLREALTNELNKEDFLFADEENKEQERRAWLRYVDDYKNGDFYYQEDSRFSVDYYEVFLNVTFKIKGKTFTKVFRSYNHYGN